MVHDFELDGDPGRYHPHRPRPGSSFGIRHLLDFAFFLACGLILLALILPQSSHCGEPMRRAQCINNLKQIGLALASYRQEYGALPPAFIADARGRPLHSWRVLLLPFLDRSDLYERYDFKEPWDGPRNAKLIGEMPSVYACPTRMPFSKGLACYVAITGPGTMFPDGGPVRFDDVKDGLENTLMLAETATLDIPWTQPCDLDVRAMDFRVNERHRPCISSQHQGGANVALGDGSVLSLRDGIAPDELRALTTIAGGEKIDVLEGVRSR